MGIISFFKKSILSSKDKILNSVASVVFQKKKIDQNAINDIEEKLILSDIGPGLSSKIIKAISKKYLNEDSFSTEVIDTIKSTIIQMIYDGIEVNLHINWQKKLNDIASGNKALFLFVGLNGSGKTTTIAKVAYNLKKSNLTGKIVCGDTFRSGAVSQLMEWANKLNIEGICANNIDPSSIIYTSIKSWINDKDKIDYLLIDTAGRVHLNTNLMMELGKIDKIIDKFSHNINSSDDNLNFQKEIILVIDGSTGQNVYKQIEEFQKYLKINGIIVTKLDTNAKGGIIIGILDQFKLPIYLIGKGENFEDLEIFDINLFLNEII